MAPSVFRCSHRRSNRKIPAVLNSWDVLYRRFVSRFCRFVNFVSRYRGVLSPFINFNSPGKIMNCSISTLGKKDSGKTGEKKKQARKKNQENLQI